MMLRIDNIYQEADLKNLYYPLDSKDFILMYENKIKAAITTEIKK